MILKIKNLRANAVIGVYEWENSKRQIIINAEAEIDGCAAAKSDNVTDTLDYEKISYSILEEVEKTKFRLLEALAAHLCRKVMEDKKVLRVTIEIEKPGAVRIADSVSVTHTETR